MDGAYQVYILEPLLVTVYDETGSFSEAITDSVQWKIPIKTESGTAGLAVVNESNIGLTFSGTIVSILLIIVLAFFLFKTKEIKDKSE